MVDDSEPKPDGDNELPQAPGMSAAESVEPTGWLGRPAPLYGGLAGCALYAAAYVLAFATSGGATSDGYWLLGLVVYGGIVSIALAIAGIVLVVIPHTRGFGAGVLISVAIGVVCGGGICVAAITANA